MPCRFSHVWLFATLWTIACQALLSMGFSRQEYWSGLPYPSPGNLPDLGIEPVFLMSPTVAGGFYTTSTTWKAQFPKCFLLKKKSTMNSKQKEKEKICWFNNHYPSFPPFLRYCFICWPGERIRGIIFCVSYMPLWLLIWKPHLL